MYITNNNTTGNNNSNNNNNNNNLNKLSLSNFINLSTTHNCLKYGRELIINEFNPLWFNILITVLFYLHPFKPLFPIKLLWHLFKLVDEESLLIWPLLLFLFELITRYGSFVLAVRGCCTSLVLLEILKSSSSWELFFCFLKISFNPGLLDSFLFENISKSF